MAVEEYDLDAIQAACRAFIKGTAKWHNHSFAPSAPELADEVKRQQDRLRWDAFVEHHQFIEEGSEAWRKVLMLRGASSMPTKAVDGRKGWFVPKDEIAEAARLELPRSSKVIPIPHLKGIA